MDLKSVRPSTPNMVLYDDEQLENKAKKTTTFLGGGSKNLSPPPPPVMYNSPPDSAMEVSSVGTAGRGIWTVEGQNNGAENLDDTGSLNADLLDEDDTKILLEKEFDDFYEDRAHKSAGPVVFVSKTFGMLPVIWTEDEEESECKSYFNLYTFIVFIGWCGLSAVAGLRLDRFDSWPGDVALTAENATDPKRFISRSAMDTYVAATWVAAIIAVLFSVFKCRSFAEVLFGLSEVDAQLELREKHYDKIKRKSLYWLLFLMILLTLHVFAMYTIFSDMDRPDCIFIAADALAYVVILVLDLQYLHFSMVLCKRYRLVNKILLHITKPWKTFRHEKPANIVVQNILQARFDQLFEPSGLNDDSMLAQKKDPMDLVFKMGFGAEGGDQKISKEEENTFVLQLDILRGIHADMNCLAHEVNHLLGFQILVHIITCVIFVVMFGYFFTAALIDKEFYWPYLVLFILPALKIFLIGHWGQLLEQQSRQPFMTICQVSTVDGSPRLERQVQKLTIQMHHQCPTLTAAGYFNLGRNMILKTIGVAVVFTFFMVKFQNQKDSYDKNCTPVVPATLP